MSDTWQRCVELAGVFAPLSIATVGGGQAIIADMQRQVVDVHHWMTASQFVNDFALGRMAPGPGSLLATLIGWEVAGFWGAVVATITLFGPTAIVIYGVARLWKQHSGARWQLALERGLRPVAAGMILASVLMLMKGLEGGWLAMGLALLSGALVFKTQASALAVMLAGAAIFMVVNAAGMLPA